MAPRASIGHYFADSYPLPSISEACTSIRVVMQLLHLPGPGMELGMKVVCDPKIIYCLEKYMNGTGIIFSQNAVFICVSVSQDVM